MRLRDLNPNLAPAFREHPDYWVETNTHSLACYDDDGKVECVCGLDEHMDEQS